jgi:hypothetical protein
MIGKLKLKCGSQFTSKMEGMMNDLAIGVDHEKEFAEHYKKRQAADGIRGGMEFSVQVCVTRQHGDTPQVTRIFLLFQLCTLAVVLACTPLAWIHYTLCF